MKTYIQKNMENKERKKVVALIFVFFFFYQSLLTLLVRSEAEAVWFCDREKGLDGHCTWEEALKANDASHTKEGQYLLNVVGEVKLTMNHDNANDYGTGFLFQTKNCTKNRFILTAAHVVYDLKKQRRKVTQSATFCLKEKVCYDLDLVRALTPDYNKLGRPDHSTPSEDFTVIPLKITNYPYSSIKAPYLKHLTRKEFRSIRRKAFLFHAAWSYHTYKIHTTYPCFIHFYTSYKEFKGNNLVAVNNCSNAGFGASGGPIVQFTTLSGESLIRPQVLAFEESGVPGDT